MLLGMEKEQNGHEKSSTPQPKINQIASKLAINKGLNNNNNNLATSLLTIKTEPVDSAQNGSYTQPGAVYVQVEKVDSMQPATAAALELRPVSAASTINQIANALANSKTPQTSKSDDTASSSSPGSKEFKPSKVISSNTVISKMSEALSLKQSPTLTKQLNLPVSGSSNKVQVITQYMCRYCGQQFDSSVLMQNHIQDHIQGKAPHTCSVCGKEYRTPSKLQRHVRVHSGERPYACSVCGRRFTRSDHVKQHMKVHCQSVTKDDGKDKSKLVTIKPKDQNICHLCSNMRFNRRQALHMHLQQQHMIQQVFTCHRCGEAYQSLEEMQSHKLTHDSILNSLKDGKDVVNSANAVAKFALGPQKPEEMNKFNIIKPEKNPMVELKADSLLSLTTNGYFIPANLENVSALSNKLIMEGMEKMAKEAAEIEVQKKYHEELVKLNVDASLYAEKKRELEEQAKIAACFNIKAEGKNDDDDYQPMEDDDSLEDSEKLAQKTMVSSDGMSMFIMPTGVDDSGENQAESDMEKEEDEESEQNSSKESAGLNREGVTDRAEDGEDKMEEESESNGVSSVITDKHTKEVRISPKSSGYSKPCPKSKKPGYVAGKQPDIRIVTSEEADLSKKPMVSCINPKINELIKAKVGLNYSQQAAAMATKVTMATGSHLGQLVSTSAAQPKLALIPNTLQAGATGSLQSLLVPIISGVTSLAGSSSTMNTSQRSEEVNNKGSPDVSKLLRCEHCCMWFEDNAMCLLHNTLHSADETDPFTCRKCYKKLGNRLEFMAHLVWHLEPNMDI